MYLIFIEIRNHLKKSTGLFYIYSDRYIGRIHAQMRMGCTRLNYYLFKMNLIKSPLCSCGKGNEDVLHFFLHCDKYVLQREQLHRNILEFAPFTLATILFGPEQSTIESNRNIVKLVHQYIRDTRRFLSS